MENTDKNKELEEFYIKIGENIKKLRADKGLSQLKLANAIGHDSVAHIAKAELHKYGKKFNLEHLFSICKVLHIPIQDVFNGTEDFFK